MKAMIAVLASAAVFVGCGPGPEAPPQPGFKSGAGVVTGMPAHDGTGSVSYWSAVDAPLSPNCSWPSRGAVLTDAGMFWQGGATVTLNWWAGQTLLGTSVFTLDGYQPWQQHTEVVTVPSGSTWMVATWETFCDASVALLNLNLAQ